MLLPIRQLDDTDRASVLAHLLRLDKDDRRMRFCTTMNDAGINIFVAKLDFNKFYGIGIDDPLIAFAMVVPIEDKDGHKSAEFGISIDKELRSGGIAQAMIKNSIEYCKANGITLLFMSCMHENRKMQWLARSQGLRVIIQPDEAYAEIDL